MPENIETLDIQTQLHRITDFVNDLTKIVVEIGLEAPKKAHKHRNLTADNRKKRRLVSSKMNKRNAISAN